MDRATPVFALARFAHAAGIRFGSAIRHRRRATAGGGVRIIWATAIIPGVAAASPAWGAAASESEGEVAAQLPFGDDDYRALAAFRAGLRRFVRFSEDAARAAGLSPQQHQLLLAVRGHDGPEPPTIGDLAEALQVRHHSAVGLIDRMEEGGYVRRERSAIDSRRVHVAITPAGEDVLRSLTAVHRQELRRLGDLLRPLAASGADAPSEPGDEPGGPE